MSYWICVAQDICPITVQMKVSPCLHFFFSFFFFFVNCTSLTQNVIMCVLQQGENFCNSVGILQQFATSSQFQGFERPAGKNPNPVPEPPEGME